MTILREGTFTVDDLFDLPDWGLRSEVLGGRLVLAPPTSRRHDRVVANLTNLLSEVLDGRARVQTGEPVRLSGGDGPVPDALVTSGVHWPRGWPAALVHTVVEVVGADGQHVDQVWKRDRYAAAGIPCYWRVELVRPWWLRGQLPVLVVRCREPWGWRELVAPAGKIQLLPVAHGREAATGAAVCTPVRLDPAWLLSRPAAGR